MNQMFPIFFVAPHPLIWDSAVAEGWLLLDIGWFVLFLFQFLVFISAESQHLCQVFIYLLQIFRMWLYKWLGHKLYEFWEKFRKGVGKGRGSKFYYSW